MSRASKQLGSFSFVTIYVGRWRLLLFSDERTLTNVIFSPLLLLVYVFGGGEVTGSWINKADIHDMDPIIDND